MSGAADEQMEITSGVAELSVAVNRSTLARYGLNVTDVEEAVEAGRVEQSFPRSSTGRNDIRSRCAP